jgi:hypothetical protein
MWRNDKTKVVIYEVETTTSGNCAQARVFALSNAINGFHQESAWRMTIAHHLQ